MSDVVSDGNEWNDDQASNVNEASLHYALETGAESSIVSIPIEESIQGISDLDSPQQSLFLVKLLGLKEANHIEFCRIKYALDEILLMYRTPELNGILKL
ncbi:hypothetical protein K1719_020884 [Acacia pycnantha]|nr:hypothetical protein K1719_020884 [Acacia pycnantha]